MKYKEKKIYCGEYLEVDVIPFFEGDERKSRRGKRICISSPVQMNLNDKNAKRYCVQKVNTNFTEKDYYITLTYKRKFDPKSIEEAERELKNFLNRLRRKVKKLGQELKYIVVTEFKELIRGDRPVNVHHHLIMNGVLPRDEIEDTWRKPRKKGEKNGEPIGTCNTRRLQPGEHGFEEVARYIAKDIKKGKKRWSCSQNLKNPYYTENCDSYSKKKVIEAAKVPDDKSFFEKKYKGYLLTDCKPVFNDVIGMWSLYIKMRKWDTDDGS